MHKYILNERGEPVEESDVLKWTKWYETREPDGNWIVDKTKVGESEVSTVFLAIDHCFHFGPEPHRPILWETMVFGGPLDGEQERYRTRPEAEVGHASMVERVCESQSSDEFMIRVKESKP